MVNASEHDHTRPRRPVSDGEMRAAPPCPGAFTLLELLIVIAVIVVLLAIFAPAFVRLGFMTRSTQCGIFKHKVAAGMINYATDNHRYFPARYPQPNTYNHAYWYGLTNNASRNMNEVFEEYLGGLPPGGGPPTLLVCPVGPKGIWGVDITWPLGTIYRSNVVIYAGYDWATTSANSCVPRAPLDQMPQRLGEAPNRPLAGDLIEYMSGNSASGYSGWDTPHTFDSRYHARTPGGPEAQPPDPIPFAYGDGSVRFTRDLEPCYTDQGWGTNYWPVP